MQIQGNSGIPDDSKYCALVYSTYSNCIVVQVSRKESGLTLSSLYRRRIDEDKYFPLLQSSNSSTYENPTSDHDSPLLLFNEFQWKEENNSSGKFWVALKAINLETLETIDLLTHSDFDWPDSYDDGWVSQIHQSEGQAKKIVVTMALKKKISDNSYDVEYWLSELELSGEEKIKKLALLRNAFY